jgi:hypothetical protein
MIPLIPVLLAGGSWLAYRRFFNKGMTPDRKKIYDAAIVSMQEPVKLRALADTFEKEGLRGEADMLRKRAALREAPPAVKAARRMAFKKAMGSDNPDAILEVAKAHEALGAMGAAAELKLRAANVSALKTA